MRKFIVFVMFLLMASGAHAQDYNVYKLPNGQTIIIKELHDNAIVTIDTWIKTGSIDENDKNNGVAHFLEHLFFKGTQKYPTGEFDKILESKGAITNAATNKDYTHYYVTLPSKDFDLALSLHADMLLNPLVPRKELEKERKVVLEEISKSNDTPTNKLYNNMISALYKDHPYKRKVIGRNEVIETITREEMLDFYNRHYTPENMVTIIVGDVDANSAIKKAENLFGAKPASKNKKTVYKKEKPLAKSVEIIDKDNVQTCYMLLAFRGTDSLNRKDSYALDLLATILGDGKTSILYQNIKEQKRLAYSISAGHATSKDDSIFYINASYKPEDYPKLKTTVLEEINKLKTAKIDEEQIKKAKSMIERDTYYSRESVSNIANELGYMAVLYDDIKAYKEYVANINKVTADELLAAARKYLDVDGKMVISVLEPKDTAEPNPQIKGKETPFEGKATLVKQNGKVSKYILNNNETLILNKNTANDIIAIQIYAKGGEFLEKKPGIADLMASLILKGTDKYTALEIQQLLEQNGIKMDFSSAADAFSISIKATKNEMPIVFDILNQLVNHATFDTYELEKIKSEKLYAIKKRRDLPMESAFEEFKSRIWCGYPYGNTGKVFEKTIPSITVDDIAQLYNQMFYPANVVISVNGNISEKELAQNFSGIFADKEGSSVNITDFKKNQMFLNKTEFVNIKRDAQAAWIILGWPVPGLMDVKDYAALQVINSILGTGMSSRLFVNLRDQQGLAYQIGSTYSPYVNRGTFALYIATNPQNIALAKREMLHETDRIKKEFISDKELSEAKEKILGNYIISFETNMEKAATLGWYEASGRGFDFVKDYPKLIEAVTPSDIIGVANKYFEKPYLNVILSSDKHACE